MERALADERVVSADDEGEETDPDDNQAWAVYEGATAAWQCVHLPADEAAREACNSACTAVADAVGISSSPAWVAAQRGEHVAQTRLLRDIFENPFRPVSISPAWQTQATKAVAQAIYDERRFEDLPILADALEEAGCANANLLAHCRGPGPHVRGCWVVDALLGKE